MPCVRQKDEWQAAYESQPKGSFALSVTTLGQMREWNEHRPVDRVALLS